MKNPLFVWAKQCFHATEFSQDCCLSIKMQIYYLHWLANVLMIINKIMVLYTLHETIGNSGGVH